jgi:acid phosphatase
MGNAVVASIVVVLLASCAAPPPQRAGLDKIEHIVVIYAENRSFDNLYGLFPGAYGIANATPEQYTQVDFDGKPLPHLPPVWKGNNPDPAFPKDLPNKPFRIDAPPINLPLSTPTRDLIHKFYPQQEQINGGRNNRFAEVSDAGALTMGYYDGAKLPMWKWAQDYVLADRFFMGAFGDSYLNHFWLICACTPVDPGPANLHAQLDERGWLKRRPDSPSSALTGPAVFVSGEFTTDGYSLSTNQPPYEPSRVPPAAGGDARFADPTKQILPPQTRRTIGDALSAKGISWVWYAGAWNAAVKDGMQPAAAKRMIIYNNDPPAPYFVAHHQPFNYFVNFAPGTAAREQHLKDYIDLVAGIEKGDLPAVAFYKPQGTFNEHPGNTDACRRHSHRRAGRQNQGEPLVGVDSDHRHLRRERRLLGSRAAAQRRPLGAGHADSGDHHLAVRETCVRRSHDLRYDVDHQVHHQAFRPRGAARRARGCRRSYECVRFRRLMSWQRFGANSPN